MADSRHERNVRSKEPVSTYPTLFVQAKDLPKYDKQIYGLKIYHAVEAVTGGLDKSECVQKIRGLWRLTMKDSLSRATILTKGLTIRGYHVNVLSKNPFLSPEGEETVRLRINNIPYSVSHETIKNKLKSIGVVFTNDIQWEMYKDDNKGMLSCKTGRRFVSISPPKNPLPKSILIAEKFTAFLSYQGQDDPVVVATSQTEVDRPGRFGATQHSPLRMRPTTQFRFGNDPNGRKEDPWNLKKTFNAQQCKDPKSKKDRKESDTGNILSYNQFDTLHSVPDEHTDDDSMTQLKSINQALELEPGEIPSEASDQKSQDDAGPVEADWWDFVDTAYGTDPEEGRNYGCVNKDTPTTTTNTDTSTAPEPSENHTIASDGKKAKNSTASLNNGVSPSDANVPLPRAPHPKPQPRKGKAVDRKQLTLDDMATRGRQRARSTQKKKSRASRGSQCSHSPSLSENGRSGSKRRGGDESKSTDSKRRKSVSNTILPTTAPR